PTTNKQTKAQSQIQRCIEYFGGTPNLYFLELLCRGEITQLNDKTNKVSNEAVHVFREKTHKIDPNLVKASLYAGELCTKKIFKEEVINLLYKRVFSTILYLDHNVIRALIVRSRDGLAMKLRHGNKQLKDQIDRNKMIRQLPFR